MSVLSKIDRAITTLNFYISQKKETLERESRKVDITENAKIKIGTETQFIQGVEILIKHCKNDVNKGLGKLPPQATDLEEAILGALMLERDGIKVTAYLEVDHFYLESHRAIYEAILALVKEAHPIDMRTVVSKLRSMGKLELIGGAVMIAELTSKVSSAANIEYHARILIEMAIKRQLIILAGAILNDAYDDTKDCFEILEYGEEEFKKINTWIK